MKTLIIKLFILILFVLVANCKKDKHSSPNEGKGTLSVNIEIDIQVLDLPGNFKATEASADSFSIDIYNAADELAISYDYAIDMPENIELEADEYYVVATYGEETNVGFEQPYLTGQSAVVQVDVEQNTEVTVNCEVKNCAVSIVYSQDIIDHFDSYATEVSSAHGSLTFDESESRYGYFPLSPIDIECTLNYETLEGPQQKTLQGQIPGPLAAKLYEIRLDASLENGQLAIQINLDESLETEVIEINEADDEPNEWLGALVISEIMYNPDALTDSEGEWFEIYNPTDSVININNLVIRKDDDNHVIAMDKDMVPGEYYALVRTANAVSGDAYAYGTGISLNNSGANLGIYTYGTDGSDGKEICEVNYTDGGDFPTGASGAAIQLSSGSLQADEAKMGANWCNATNAYDTGDLGTPGAANNSCD